MRPESFISDKPIPGGTRLMKPDDLVMDLTVREDTPPDGVAAILDGVAVPYGTRR